MARTGSPLLGFAVLVGVGIALGSLVSYASAATGYLSLGNEGSVIAFGTAAALIAAWHAGLARWSEIGLAAGIGTALHLIIHYLPLGLLLELPVNRYVLEDLAGIALSLLPYYAVAVASAVLFAPLFRKFRGTT